MPIDVTEAEVVERMPLGSYRSADYQAASPAGGECQDRIALVSTAGSVYVEFSLSPENASDYTRTYFLAPREAVRMARELQNGSCRMLSAMVREDRLKTVYNGLNTAAGICIGQVVRLCSERGLGRETIKPDPEAEGRINQVVDGIRAGYTKPGPAADVLKEP